MFAVRKLNKMFNLYYNIHILVGCRCSSDYKAHESSIYMQKLINKHGAKTKKKWYQTHTSEPVEMFTLQQPANRRGETPAQRIRATQLGHVLYDKITHIINTGELSPEILHKQVLILSVKMQADFGGIHVYWDSSRSDAAEVEGLLQAHARKLRSLLISYHVLGRIPPVTFVKDRAMGDLVRLNQLFDVADYGPDNDVASEEVETQTNEASRRFTKWSIAKESKAKAHKHSSHEGDCPVPGSVKMANSTDVAEGTPAVDENNVATWPPTGDENNVATWPPTGDENNVATWPPTGDENNVATWPPTGEKNNVATWPPTGEKNNVATWPPTGEKNNVATWPPTGEKNNVATWPPTGEKNNVATWPPTGEKNNVATWPPTGEKNNTCNEAELVQDRDIDLADRLHFRSNLYSLPHEDLMKKVAAHKLQLKDSSSQTLSLIKDSVAFDFKQFKSKKDKLKLMSHKNVSRLKEELLLMDVGQFVGGPSEDDGYTEELEEEDGHN